MRGRIEGITHKGEGVARIEGKAVFVPYAILGEEVEIEIIEEKKNYAKGRLIKVLSPDSSRIEPFCPHYYECGGCVYQHTDYLKQLELKHQIVKDSMTRIGKILAPVNPVLGMNNPWHYRNKVTWHVSKGRLGYYQPGSHQLVHIKTCKLISEKMEQVSNMIQEMMEAFKYRGNGEVVIRHSMYQDKIMAVFSEFNLLSPDKVVNYIKSAVDSIYFYNNNKLNHVYGEPFLYEKVLDRQFKLSPLSFFQVNNVQNEKLITQVKEFLDLKGSEVVLDAYCGIGNISLFLAEETLQVTGIESNQQAVDDARENALNNGLNNCEFICAPCEKVLPHMNVKFDAAVVDPPRSGLKTEVITAIVNSSPKKIIYVSCSPGTLARDLALFAQKGYQTAAIQPVDMFAQTGHVECVVLMSRVEK